MTRVVLHIGAPKTGTSFIQSVLSNNPELLQTRGVLWPGAAWSDQVRAVEDLRDTDHTGGSSPRWDALVAEIDRFTGSTAVVSMEWLCLGSGDMARRAIASLDQHEVHVVLTLRDLARAIPAQWQESTQNGFGWTYPTFLNQLSGSQPNEKPAGRHFWTNQDWARMAATWAPLVPLGRFSVVTVPPAGASSDLLWTRFCQAAGIAPEGYSLEGWPNESLGAASAEIMRRLQVARRSEPRNPRHKGRLKHRLAKQTLATHRKAEPSLILPPEFYNWTLATSKQLIASVRRNEPTVVGDLDELLPLRPVLAQGVVTDPGSIDDATLLDAALFGLLGLTRPKS